MTKSSPQNGASTAMNTLPATATTAAIACQTNPRTPVSTHHPSSPPASPPPEMLCEPSSTARNPPSGQQPSPAVSPTPVPYPLSPIPYPLSPIPYPPSPARQGAESLGENTRANRLAPTEPTTCRDSLREPHMHVVLCCLVEKEGATMRWTDAYRAKCTTADEAVRVVQP